MTRRRLIIANASLLTPAILLAGQAVHAADIGYPPPPGPYRSEPTVLSVPGLSGSPAMQTRPEGGGDRPPPAQQSARLLALPGDRRGGETDGYDANNLFGSAVPGRPSPAATPARRSFPEAQDPPPPGFSPSPYPAERDPGSDDFSMDFRRIAPKPQSMSGSQQPEGRPYAAYPPYSAGYPGAPHPDTRYPVIDHAPATAGPGYQTYHPRPHAQGYSRDRIGLPPQKYRPSANPAAPGYAPDGYYARARPPGQQAATLPIPEPGHATASTPVTRPFPAEEAALEAPAGGAVFRPAD